MPVGRLVNKTSTTVLGGQLGCHGVLPLVNLKVQAAGASDSRSAVWLNAVWAL